MHRTRFAACCGSATLGLVLGFAFSLGSASAQDKTFELKISHWVPPSRADVKKAGRDPGTIWKELQASLKQYDAGC